MTQDEIVHSVLNEKILDLFTTEEDEYEEEEYQGSIYNIPSWYHQVYFPGQTPDLEIVLCKNVFEKVGKGIKNGGKETFKGCKKAIKGAGKGIDKAVDFAVDVGKGVGKGCEEVGKGAKKLYKKVTGKSKKGWDKTKKFVQQNKKAILIGLAIVAVVAVAIVCAPELASLLAALVPKVTDDEKSDTKIAATNVETLSYTEENLFEDCIEIVQEGLLASGINNILVEDSALSKTLEQVKGVSSMLCHQLIDVLDTTVNLHDVFGQLQSFNNTQIDQKQFEDINNSYERLKYKFNSYLEDIDSQGNANAHRMIDYLHTKTDEVFGTSLAAVFTPESKAFRSDGIQMLEVPLPLPGRSLGSSDNKNLLRKFTENNYRKNLKALTPQNDYSSIHAHHVFPQAFKEYFLEKGINIHDPKLMTWWEESTHLPQAKSYNDAWIDFIKKNPEATKEQILENGKKLMKNFGKEVNY